MSFWALALSKNASTEFYSLEYFFTLITFFQESCKEDEALEPLLDAVRVLTAMLGKTEGENDKEPGTKITRTRRIKKMCSLILECTKFHLIAMIFETFI